MNRINLCTVLSLCFLISLAQGCTKIVSGSIFDFSQLASSTYNTSQGPTGTLYWNACSNTLSANSCNQANIYAAFYPNPNNANTCQAITGTTTFNAASFSYVDSSDHSNGIAITYSNGQTYGQYTTSFTLKVLCDSSVTNGFTTKSLIVSETLNYLLTVSSSAGCPTIDFSSLWDFLNNNKWVSVAIMFTLGVFLCFFGLKFLKATLLITGFLLGFAVSFIIWEAVMPQNSSNGLNWTALIVSVLVGICGSILAFKIEKAGIFALGALGGTFLGMIIFNTFHFGSQQKYVLYLEIGLCGFICGSLAVYIKDYILILASSLTGAYLIVRSISLYAGGFPNEFNVSQEIQNGNYSFPWYYYLYLAAIIVLKIAGGVYQYRQRKASKKGKREGSSNSDDYRRI